jgi:hypothetical protein
MVVAGTTDVRVQQRQFAVAFGRRRRLPVETVLQDRRHAAVGTRTDLKPARTSCLDAVAAVAAYQAQDAKTGAEALLGIWPGVQDQRRQPRCRSADRRLGPLRGPSLADALDRPLGMAAVRLRHVFGQRRVPAARATTQMHRNPLALSA